MGEECWSRAYRNFRPRAEAVSPKRGREMKRSEWSGSACILIIGDYRGVKFM